jgi:hypothetical protein
MSSGDRCKPQPSFAKGEGWYATATFSRTTLYSRATTPFSKALKGKYAKRIGARGHAFNVNNMELSSRPSSRPVKRKRLRCVHSPDLERRACHASMPTRCTSGS